MQDFRVDGMTYGHCEWTVTEAVRGVDPSATVEVDRAAGRVRVNSTTAPGRIAEATAAEGYAAEPVEG